MALPTTDEAYEHLLKPIVRGLKTLNQWEDMDLDMAVGMVGGDPATGGMVNMTGWIDLRSGLWDRLERDEAEQPLRAIGLRDTQIGVLTSVLADRRNALIDDARSDEAQFMDDLADALGLQLPDAV